MTPERATAAHVDEAIRWMEARGLNGMSADMFSDVGYVVDGVAALWLYMTKSSLAYLEMLVSNPKASSADRDWALNAVIQACADHARIAGCRTVLAPVANPDIVARGATNGFITVAVNVTLIAKPLTEGAS